MWEFVAFLEGSSYASFGGLPWRAPGSILLRRIAFLQATQAYLHFSLSHGCTGDEWLYC